MMHRRTVRQQCHLQRTTSFIKLPLSTYHTDLSDTWDAHSVAPHLAPSVIALLPRFTYILLVKSNLEEPGA